MATRLNVEDRARVEGGWRTGKPEEDPQKTKTWGRIAARPSEYLIHVRRGQVLPSSGQGSACFKWPGDAVAIVPTTLQRLHFTADQVTREKVGVQVTGIAVYRIADPHLAFRMLNFSFPERAQEKLEQVLGEMFIGAVRRLVANLGIEDCLSRRKEGIASELIREIAPVVSGHGRPDDGTDRGWGVVIDTIEIQDVKVLSEKVFADMQAAFRSMQARQAREAALEADRAVRTGEAEAQRQIGIAEVEAQLQVAERRRAAEEQAALAEQESQSRLAAARHQEALAEAARVAQAALAEQESQARLAAARHDELLAEAARAARLANAQHEEVLAAAVRQAQLARTCAEAAEARRAAAEAELAVAELEARRQVLAMEPELHRLRAARALENDVSPMALQLAVARRLPKLAAALGKVGPIHVTAVDGANPFGTLTAMIESVMGLARAAGIVGTTGPDGSPSGSKG